MGSTEVNMHDWFAEDELDTCPRCKRRAALTTPDTGVVVCIECGVVGVRAAGDMRGDSLK